MESAGGASASKPRSWSSYDIARRRRRTENETNESALADGDGGIIPDRTSVDAAPRVQAPSSSAASAAAVSAAVASALGEVAATATATAGSNPGTTTGRTGKGVAPRRGIDDALSVPAADGVSTTLRFQWVRPHPSDAFLLAAAIAAAEKTDDDASGDGGGDRDDGIRGQQQGHRRFGWGHDMPPPSAELSGMVYYPHRSRKRRREEKESGNDENRRGTADDARGGASRGSYRSRRERGFVGNGNGGDCVVGDNIRVDASDLCFDPPLLTEWLPGVQTSCSYDVGDTDDSSSSSSDVEEGVKDESGDGVVSAAGGEDDEKDRDSSRSSSAVMELLGEIMEAHRSSAGGAAPATEDDLRRERRLRALLSAIAKLSQRELSTVLPSHLLVKTVSDCYRRNNPDRDGDQRDDAGVSEGSRRVVESLSLALVALCSLAGASPSDGGSAMGRHILRVLSPIALDPSSYHRRSTIGSASSGRGGGGDDVQQPPAVAALTTENEGLVRRLAGLLVSDGGLGELSRSELRTLLSSVEQQEQEEEGDRLGSELMDELMCCVSEAYLG